MAAVFLVYLPAWNGGFLFDDDLHLLNNPVLRPGGLAKIWVPGGYLNYWPLTYTAYWVEYQLWGLTPLGFHWVNLAGHAISRSCSGVSFCSCGGRARFAAACSRCIQ